jgi:hypothetical protein
MRTVDRPSGSSKTDAKQILSEVDLDLDRNRSAPRRLLFEADRLRVAAVCPNRVNRRRGRRGPPSDARGLSSGREAAAAFWS